MGFYRTLAILYASDSSPIAKFYGANRWRGLQMLDSRNNCHDRDMQMKCGARQGNTGPNYPQDCDAPFCGCNPAWSECIEMLIECGLLPEWRPIESAPANGKWVLVWWEEVTDMPIVAYFNNRSNLWHEGFGDNSYGAENQPTHWVPLLKGPKK
jgi:hypothetical protein